MAGLFRPLRVDEIECRINTVNEKGCTVLLYKDARADMDILDETVGSMNWKREHSRDNANCTVSIWDAEKGQWISKEDTGTESNTEKEKGLASDSFKRACVNWGIGRELYSSPLIWIPAGMADIRPHPRKQGEFTCYDRFQVDEIGYSENGVVNWLKITKKGKPVFTMGGSAVDEPATKKGKTKEQPEVAAADPGKVNHETLVRLQMLLMSRKDKYTIDYVAQGYAVNDLADLGQLQAEAVIKWLEEHPSK